MMSELLLTVASNCVKLWGSKSYNLQQEIITENDCQIHDVSWNRDGKIFATIGENRNEVSTFSLNTKILTFSLNTTVTSKILPLPSCLQFANVSSRHLAVGNSDGCVVVWDLKQQSFKKKYDLKSNSTFTRLRFSPIDSHITMSTASGNLFLLSLVNNAINGPLVVCKDEEILDISYSKLKKSLLAVASYQGYVHLFDTNVSHLYHTFTTKHAAPVSCVTFSPINENLLLASSYDGKFTCFDNKMKDSALLTTSTSSPLTCATFMGQQFIALGSMSGQVFIYDLRNIGTGPLKTIDAHKQAVVALQLQPLNLKHSSLSEDHFSNNKLNNDKNFLSVTASDIHISKSENVPASSVLNFCQDNVTNLNNSAEDVFFSPVRSHVNFVSQKDTISSIPAADNSSHLSPFVLNRDFGMMFSPVRSDTTCLPIVTKSPMPLVEKEAASSSFLEKEASLFLEKEVPSLLEITDLSLMEKETPSYAKKENVNLPVLPLASTNQSNLNDNLMLPQVLPVPNVILNGTECEKVNSCEQKKENVLTATISCHLSRKILLPNHNKKVSEMHNMQDDSEELSRHLNYVSQSKQFQDVATNTDALCYVPSAATEHLQLQLIRSCMLDALEPFCNNIVRRIENNKLVMIRSQLEHEKEISKLHIERELIEELIRENEQLKQENAELKSFY